MASSEGKRRWQELLQELQQELERQSARLEQLEKRDAGSAAGIAAPMKTRSLSLKNWASEHAGFSGGSHISNSASLRVSSSLRSMASMSIIWQTRSGTMGTTSKYKPWYVVNPDSFFYAVIWKYVITASALYVALITPLQACTMELEMSFFLVFGFLVDVVFIIDLVLQFFVQITVHTSVGVKRVNSLRRIAIHYLQSWFFCDLLVAMPFNLLGILTLDIEERTVRILWMLKLFRRLKPSRLWHLIDVPYSIKHQQEWLLLRFLGLLLLLCHWFACLWCLSLHLDNNEASWRDAINLERQDYGLEQLTAFQTYVLAYYFCSYTMTSVGYGDIGPRNELEVLLCICMVICTGFCWAFVLGQICAIVAGINEESQAFRMRMHNLNVMMQTEDLPDSLQDRLRTFFLQNRNLAQHQHNLNLLNSMSPQLQSEVCFTSNLPWLRKVSFFDQFIQHFESIESQGLPANSYRACLAEMSRSAVAAEKKQKQADESRKSKEAEQRDMTEKLKKKTEKQEKQILQSPPTQCEMPSMDQMMAPVEYTPEGKKKSKLRQPEVTEIPHPDLWDYDGMCLNPNGDDAISLPKTKLATDLSQNHLATWHWTSWARRFLQRPAEDVHMNYR